jgi:TolB-like protein
VLVLLGGIAAVAAKLRGPGVPAAAGSTLEELAQIGVRPFTDLTGTPDLARMAETFSVDLVSELARVPLLRVRSASAIAPLRSVTPDSIRRALGVGTLIEGSVAEARDSIRISARIVTTLTGDEIGRGRWTVPRARVLILGDSLVQEMGRFVRDLLGRELQSQRGRLGTASAEAWEHYQMGNTTFNEVRRLYQSGETTAAMKLFKVGDSLLSRAVSLDPRWSEALLAKGWLNIWRGVGRDSASIAEADVWNRQAIDIAARVLRNRPGHPEAHELQGTGLLQIAINGRGDSTTLTHAESELRLAAVASNASQARAWFRLATVMRWQGRPAEANVAARRAYDLDAFLEQADELLAQLCSTSFELNQVRDAQEWCAEGKRRFPGKFEFAYHLLQMMPFSRDRPHPDSSLALYRTVVRLTPVAERAAAMPGWQLMLAAALARAGLPDSARRLLIAAEAARVALPDLDVYAAAAWLALGETGNALDRLGAFLRKNPHMKQVVASHPSFAGLEHDPRFQRLVSRDPN